MCPQPGQPKSSKMVNRKRAPTAGASATPAPAAPAASEAKCDMKRLDISKLLAGVSTPEAFSLAYENEVSRYVDGLQKAGSSVLISLEGEEEIFVDEASFANLLEKAADGRLSPVMLGYILDAISLDQGACFSSDELRETVLDYSDDVLRSKFVRKWE